jgi:exodeoxyribonuclease VII large subunit
VPDGIGALHLAYEQLKRALEKEGFFSSARKRAIPKFPEKIGIATSLDGEVLRDMLAVIKRRNPNIQIYFASTVVQGMGAEESISRSIKLLNSIEDIDVIIVGRGGGSVEDLWAFNEEAVARAIYNSRVPVVTAIGHEGDFTIADLVADLRAPTPSAAAEMVVPDRKILLKEVAVLKHRLHSAMMVALYKLQQLLREKIDKLDPKHLHLNHFYQRQDEILARLQFLIEYQIKRQSERVLVLTRSLHALNPLKIIERGYCLALKQSVIVRSRSEVKPGDCLRILVSDGEIICRVEEVSAWHLNIAS